MDEVAIFQAIENDHIGSQQAENQITNWHPNILRFYNWYETRNHFWIILEYCSGGDLFSLLEKEKKLPEESVKKFAFELLEGLSYLHSQGIIFGDLKPANVLLDEFSRLKLCDFGLAKKITDLSNLNLQGSAEERASSHSNNAKNKAGTPYYMAPELFQDSGIYSYFSDFWSLGCILVEMATGRPPFYTSSLKELIQQIMVQDIPVVPKFSDEFNSLVKLILQKDPISRINWEEIKAHPWWTTPVHSDNSPKNAELNGTQQYFSTLRKAKYKFTKRIYQPQLHFDKYLKTVRNIDPKQYHAVRMMQGNFGQQLNLDAQSSSNVDPLRISYTVKKNMELEEQRNRQEQKQLEDQVDEMQAKRAYQRGQQESSSTYQESAPSEGQPQTIQNKYLTSETFQGPKKSNPYKATKPQDPDQWKEIGDSNLRQDDGYHQIGLKSEKQQEGLSKLDFYKTQQTSNSKKSSYSGFQEETKSTYQETQTKQGIRRDGSSQNLDQYDYNLQKNKKMVLDFSHQDSANAHDRSGAKTAGQGTPYSQKGVMAQDGSASLFTQIPPSVHQNKKSSSPLPSKATQPSQGSNQARAGAFSYTQQKQAKDYSMNNFFQKQNTPQQTGGDPSIFNQASAQPKAYGKIFQNKTKSQSPNEKLKSGQPQRVMSGLTRHDQPNFKSQTQQNLFKTQNTLGGGRSPNPGIIEQQQTSHTMRKPEVSTTKISQTKPLLQNYDKLNFLNDQFDDFDDLGREIDDTDEQVMNIDNQMGQGSSTKNNGAFKQEEQLPKLKIHVPSNPPQAIQTMKLGKEMILFSSTMSQAQIKAEIQALVSQTVQIGPVPSQNTQSSQSSAQTMASNSSQTDLSRNQPTQMKVPLKSIDQLIIHTSDTSVKPIVGNQEIERIPKEQYNTEYLRFTPWSSEDIVNELNSAHIDNHLSDVYKSIASDSNIEEKVNALQYFESLIVNSNVSNQLINSAFTSLLKKMLDQNKSPVIKIRVCSVIGLLIRHSTMIDNDLAEIDIASQLINALKDSNELVRRRAIAALGEYMFYAATQLDDEMADPIWNLSESAINIIVDSLDETEPDRGVRFYACKTLENICAQSVSAGVRFSTPQTVQHVLKIYMMEKKDPTYFFSESDYEEYKQWYEGIKMSASIALSHMCKLNHQLFPMIFERFTPSLFCANLLHDKARVQQAFLTMLNLALYNIKTNDIADALLKEPGFLPALKKQLEHTHIVIRGKAILTSQLLIQKDYRWMIRMQQEIKFFNDLDRILRDNYKYVQCCLLSLANCIQEVVPEVFQQIFSQLNNLLDSSKQSQAFHYKLVQQTNDPTNLRFIRSAQNEYGDYSEIQLSPLYMVTILLDLQTNPLIRTRLLSSPMIQALASMLDLIDVNSFQGAPIFLNSLLIMTENLSANYRILEILAKPILTYLVPVLLNKISNSDDESIKYLSFKIFTDIMLQYINDPQIYVYDRQEGQISRNNIGELCNRILRELYPNLLQVLQSHPPIPFFGLRILSSLVERSQNQEKLCQEFKEHIGDGIVTLLSSFYEACNPMLNKHTLILMKMFIDQRQISLDTLKEEKVFERTTVLLESMILNQQDDWCLEKMVEILRTQLTHLNELIKDNEAAITDLIDKIFANFDLVVQLFVPTKYDIGLVEKATQCMIQLLQLYAQSSQRKREIFFVEDHFPYLISALKCDKPIILKRVLKCVYWAFIQTEYNLKLDPTTIGSIEGEIQKCLNSSDRSIANTSREVLKLLTAMNEKNAPVN